MSVQPGKFIVIEGLEGAGKTTALKVMKQVLSAHHIPHITTREPGGTELGELVRGVIKHTALTESLNPLAELLLFYAARVQLIEHVIRPALLKGTWVLADRFELSTFAYQGGGRKLDLNLLKELSLHCVKLHPSHVFFLDISPEQGLKRAVKRGQLDRIEQESLEFFKDVHAGYQAHLNTLQNVVRIDATQPLAVVKRKLQNAFEKIIGAS